MHPDAKKALKSIHRAEDCRSIVEQAVAKGWVRTPGGNRVPTPAALVKVALNGAVASVLEHHGIRVSFVQVTPAQARDWLIKNNKGNRKMRETTVEAFARDMRNGDWLLNHQGIAFNAEGVLLDGQHRLAAVAESGLPQWFMVSTGWPDATKKQTRLMDTVDRGAARSIADVLGLQHGVAEPRQVVLTASALARACTGYTRQSWKLTMPTVLSIVDAFKVGIKFSVEQRPKTIRLRQACVMAAVAIAYTAHPDPTAQALEKLKTGENLSGGSPILTLRNWLLSEGSSGSRRKELLRSINIVCNALVQNLNGGRADRISVSSEGLDYYLRKSAPNVAKVRSIFASGNP